MTASVLVVDDDRLIRILLRRTLTSAGFHVREADGGSLALQMARDERPSIVLLDYHMPDLEGPAVASALRAEHGPDLPIILLTASQEEEHIREAFAAGADDYVCKPINARLLGKQVEAMLRGASPRDFEGWVLQPPALDCSGRIDLVGVDGDAVLCASDGEPARRWSALLGARSLRQATEVWRSRRAYSSAPCATIAAARWSASEIELLSAGLSAEILRGGEVVFGVRGSAEQPAEGRFDVARGDLLRLGGANAALRSG